MYTKLNITTYSENVYHYTCSLEKISINKIDEFNFLTFASFICKYKYNKNFKISLEYWHYLIPQTHKSINEGWIISLNSDQLLHLNVLIDGQSIIQAFTQFCILPILK
jgi:hypothetical protein